MELHDGVFRLSPLLSQDSLRLLLLEEPSPEGLIRCKIQQFDAHHAPPYRALSYYWGNPDPIKTIELNGHRKGIHDNLWQFLDQMTLDGDFGYYWTDALCIDQQNIQERNAQVARMDEIYLCAEEVFVWLGRDEQMQSWMWLVESFYYFEYQKGESRVRRNLSKPALDILRDERMVMHMLPAAMAGLLEATYWTRLWIVQEVALARGARVRCGSFSLLLEHFEAVLGYCRIGKMVSASSPGMPNTDEDHRSFRFREPPATTRALRIMSLNRGGGRELLWELLNEFSDGRCSEPRDKIYSLLSLARPNTGVERVRDLIGVDYGKRDLDVFWDALFECDAPFNWLTIIMSQLESYLHVAGNFETLDEYRRSTSVSSEHRRYAMIAIEVFWAIRSYKRRWWKDITASQLDAMVAGKKDWGSESKEDNAILIGLLLSTGHGQPNELGRIIVRRSTSASQKKDQASVGGGKLGRWYKPNSLSTPRYRTKSIPCSKCNEGAIESGADRTWSELEVDTHFPIPGTESRLIIPKKQGHAKMWLETTKFTMHIPSKEFEPVLEQQQDNPRWGTPLARRSQHTSSRISQVFKKLSK